MNGQTEQKSLSLFWICVLLALGTLALYWQVTGFEFTNYDDNKFVTENPAVLGGLTLKGLRWAFTTGFMGNWHPLTWISHMLDCELFHQAAGMHHLVNVVIHALNTLLLFVVLRRMTGAQWRSAMVAALFAWHPLHVESVAWVAERKDVLSALFFLLTLLAYARYVEESNVQSPKSGFFYRLTFLFFALGLMSKPMLVTLPFVLLLLDFWPLGRVSGLKSQVSSPDQRPSTLDPRLSTFVELVREKLPLFVLAVCVSVVTYATQKNGRAAGVWLGLTPSGRFGNAVVSYVRYLGKTFWPSSLGVFYPHPGRWPLVVVLASAALLILITIAALVFLQRRPWFGMGWLWFVGTLVPVIGIVQIGAQSMADRYMYIPQIGLLIAVVWFSAEMLGRMRASRIVMALLAVAVLAGCLVVSWRQIGYWRNSVSLFARAIAITENNSVARYNYGTAVGLLGDHEEAKRQYAEVLRINPDFFLALVNMGCLLHEAGQFKEATNFLARAVRLAPNDSLANHSLGLALAALGDLHGAEARFAVACAAEKNDAMNQCDWGTTLLALGRTDEAVEHLSAALRLDPKLAAAHAGMGIALTAQHRTREAAAYYRVALQLQPVSPSPAVLNNLAWLLATDGDSGLRDGAEAVRLAKQACELTDYKQAQLVGTLAAAQAEAGQFGEAVASAQTAIDLAHAAGDEALAEKNRRLLKLYQAKQPFRDTP